MSLDRLMWLGLQMTVGCNEQGNVPYNSNEPGHF